MMFRNVFFALGTLLAGNAIAQTSFSVYFNGESPTANCHVDGVTNAQLSTSGSGNLVATAATPLAFSTACGVSGSGQQLTFGPAQDLLPATQTLAAGSNVIGSFSVRPYNAASCTATIGKTSGSGTVSPTNINVCTSQLSCKNLSTFSANFTNTVGSASTYSAQVSCAAVSGATPATLLSQTVTINQNAAGTLSNATINGAANGTTNATVNSAVSFSGAVTNPGSDPVTYSWNFGDGSATGSGQNVSHTYTTTTGSPFTVTLTVTDTSTSQTVTATNTVTVSAATGSCPTLASSTAGIANYARLTATQSVNYFGAGTQNADPTSFNSMYWYAWPGYSNLIADVSLPTNTYMSEAFTVPANYMTAANAPNPLYGRYKIGESGFSAKVSMTISTKCGDFSNPTASGSSVVSGCYLNAGTAAAFITWSNNSQGGAYCVLNNNTTYYLNIINAKLDSLTPNGGGTAASTKNQYCTTVCSVPIQNGPGTWSGYTPQ